MMPTSYVRIAAGREKMNEQMQAMCFMAGANSIFYGCKLLTATNPDEDQDMKLIRKLGLKTQKVRQSLTDEEEGASLLKDVMTLDDENYYQVI